MSQYGGKRYYKNTIYENRLIMTESEFTKALSDDIIEVLKKYNIYLKDGNVTLVNTVVDDRKLRHVIELGDSYYEKQFTILFVV